MDLVKEISNCLGFDISNREEFISNSTVGNFIWTLGEAKVKAKSINEISKAFGWNEHFNVYKASEEDSAFFLILTEEEVNTEHRPLQKIEL